MRRKHPAAGISTATLFFRENVLSVPGYAFEEAVPWKDTGSMTLLAEGHSIKDGAGVLAKIAPNMTNGSLCLEREAQILDRLQASSDTLNITLRLIEFFTIPQENGNVFVLLLAHPGRNLMGRYYPPSKVNQILLGEPSFSSNTPSQEDINMMEHDDDMIAEEEDLEVMDLASFLELAIQGTHCLEGLHKAGFIHREIRANAFHVSTHSNLVRFAHMGNRALNLEKSGGPSELVMNVEEEEDKIKVKEALCYLSPEQTGAVAIYTQDHRTDLYSYGMAFWCVLVGRGVLPFDGEPAEVLQAIPYKNVPLVHEIRRDVPPILSMIINKLVAKDPDNRYQSAAGLKADLLECQRLLLATVSSTTEVSSELIPRFELGLHDRYSIFNIPSTLFGREKELETIRNVISHCTTSFARHYSAARPYIIMSSSSELSGIGSYTGDDRSDSASSRSEPSLGHTAGPSVSHNIGIGVGTAATGQSTSTVESLASPLASYIGSDQDLRRAALRSRHNKVARVHALVVVGRSGTGKSSLILANQTKWRSHGLWGQSKFQDMDSAPFSVILGCLSSALRQLMSFRPQLVTFVSVLRERLGPQMQNIPLLYHSAPEIREILAIFDINHDTPTETLTTDELRERFHALVEHVFSVLAEIRPVVVFLDDLHEADASSLGAIQVLLNAKSNILVLATLRSENPDTVERVKNVFRCRARVTYVSCEPLPYPGILSLVARTLRREKDDVAPLARLLYAASAANAFVVRSMLLMFHRQRFISYDPEKNYWRYDIKAIENNIPREESSQQWKNTDLSVLLSHLRALHEDAQKFLIWAALFGSTFRTAEVALMMDWEDSSSSGSDGDDEDVRALSKAKENMKNALNRGSMRGLQIAVAEGWLVQRGRDMCSFAHDRYRQTAQAEAEESSSDATPKMTFRIVMMMLHDTTPDVYRIAEYAKRCLPLLHEHPKREQLLELLMDAGEAAWDRGAHERALTTFESAQTLLSDDAWQKHPKRTLNLFYRLAALTTWKGDDKGSDSIISLCLTHPLTPEEEAQLLRLQSRNHWIRSDYTASLQSTLRALQTLNVHIPAAASSELADSMFEKVKAEILNLGFDHIAHSIPRASDPRTDLAALLLTEAGLSAYWSQGECFEDIIGMTTIRLALRSGISPGTAIGFVWILTIAAERKGLYRFAIDLGRLILHFAQHYGSSLEKARAMIHYVASVSGFSHIPIRDTLKILDEAIKYALSAGDRLYACFGAIHVVQGKIFLSEHISELIVYTEETTNDIILRNPGTDTVAFAIAMLNYVRAVGGYTLAVSADTAFDTDVFRERDYVAHVNASTGNIDLAMNWYNSFKVSGLYCLGFVEEAAELGFYVYRTRFVHPNHRHTRYGLYFHSLSLIAALRKNPNDKEKFDKYIKQVHANQVFVKKWLPTAPINLTAAMSLVDAELASLLGQPDALKLYDVALKHAIDHDWRDQEGWALYLQGCHFVRMGVEGLGTEMQKRGVARHAQWGAQGIVKYLNSTLGSEAYSRSSRSVDTADAAVQTDNAISGASMSPAAPSKAFEPVHLDNNVEQNMTQLSAVDLSSVLQWSKDISSDINLSSALQRLTEIATDCSGSQDTSVAIALDQDGDCTVATTMKAPDLCQIYDIPIPVKNIDDELKKSVILATLQTKDRVFSADVTRDPRFLSAINPTLKSVICIPITGNRGQCDGALYLGSKYPIAQRVLTLMTLLCQQASISISNALLFKRVQATTREQLKMITAQKESLEIARKRREDALKATKIKSNFLASMSHELRTPFSSFYGLLDLLSGTELTPGQSEIVQTAKQSCELLLKIIDSILDYSKLEASAVKLDFSPFAVEDMLGDCMELLLPMAAKKLDLSFNIDPVPSWVVADYARIRQVLMNLIGNAVKFTSKGFVEVNCTVDSSKPSSSDKVVLKIAIQDTGIGLAEGDKNSLFVPFQQADNSSTRKFGGTGLGLSISRGLVQLMGGEIDVSSKLGEGSTFFFTVPVKLHESDQTRKADAEMQQLQNSLMRPRPLHILIISPSRAMRSHLGTMLTGFQVRCVSSADEAQTELKRLLHTPVALDFILLDDQSEAHVEELSRALQILSSSVSLQSSSSSASGSGYGSSASDSGYGSGSRSGLGMVPRRRPGGGSVLAETKIIHMYTPTTDNLSLGGGEGGKRTIFSSNTPGVVKMTKPPRKHRMLQTLATQKDLPNAPASKPGTEVEKALEDLVAVQRTLYGNVLVAEDNEIAQKLLVKQLERYQLNVTATSNGEEAIAAWASKEPGYFSVALFDHHMPVCDGVEAAKRLRVLEAKRKLLVQLPIVALSADAQESTKQLCLSAGMNAFYTKPLKKSELMSLMSMFGKPRENP